MFADLRYKVKTKAAQNCDSWQQIRLFVCRLEKVASFSMLLCINELLYCVLFLPLQTLKQLPQVGSDAVRFSLLCIGCFAIYNTANAGPLYHDLKEQDFIKLSAFYSILSVSNTLLRIFGKRVMLNLHGSSGVVAVSNWVIAALYVVLHCATMYCQQTVILVALHSTPATSALLFFNTFFYRLKSFVFKKFDKRPLFNLLCQDTSERIEFSISLLVLSLKAFFERRDNSGELCMMSCCLFAFWMLIDWIKYYFIIYTNRVPDSTFIVDFYTKLQKQNLRSALERGVYVDYWSESKMEVLLNPYSSLALSYRFPAIPLSCIVTATQIIVTLAPTLEANLEPLEFVLCLLTLMVTKFIVMKISEWIIGRKLS